jgi:hypothetical protein
MVEKYKAARKAGKSKSDACRMLMADGLTIDQAAEMCWSIETGGPAPRWLDDEGRQTKACREYDAKLDAKND